jgi:hypothetical protein
MIKTQKTQNIREPEEIANVKKDDDYQDNIPVSFGP